MLEVFYSERFQLSIFLVFCTYTLFNHRRNRKMILVNTYRQIHSRNLNFMDDVTFPSAAGRLQAKSILQIRSNSFAIVVLLLINPATEIRR